VLYLQLLDESLQEGRRSGVLNFRSSCIVWCRRRDWYRVLRALQCRSFRSWFQQCFRENRSAFQDSLISNISPETILHELIHAATINTVWAYYDNPSALSRENREAVALGTEHAHLVSRGLYQDG
jgi:hypothetical protein